MPSTGLERACTQQPVAGDIAVLDFGEEFRFDAGGLGSPDRLRQLRFGTDDDVELLPDSARNGA